MINHDSQLKLQAYLDGEIPSKDASEIQDLLHRDADAKALMAELSCVKSALKNHEFPVALPESREFYWSKIERQIRAQTPAPLPSSEPDSLLDLLRRFLAPAGALTAVLLIGLFASSQVGLFGDLKTPEIEATVADSGALTYRDFESGTTLVWVSYPAESDEEEFEDLPF